MSLGGWLLVLYFWVDGLMCCWVLRDFWFVIIVVVDAVGVVLLISGLLAALVWWVTVSLVSD